MMNEIDDSRIDDALESYPVVQLPEDFVANTMAQIEPRKRVSYRRRWRFVDYAVPLFYAGFISVVVYFIRELFQRDNGYLRRRSFEKRPRPRKPPRARPPKPIFQAAWKPNASAPRST